MFSHMGNAKIAYIINNLRHASRTKKMMATVAAAAERK